MMRSEFLDIKKLTDDKDVLRLFKVVEDHGGVLRFVGGAVRDALRDVKGYDLNLATDLSPDELAEACAEEGYDTVPMGIKQNSLGVKMDNSVVEISSLYKYVDNGEGGVDVEYTDNWEEDASRRDLTINAVYADEKGNVFDYYNGIEDLEKGYVRFIGSAAQKIKEDPLRILRYFRFYDMYGLEEPNRKAIEACAEYAELLKKVPMEKIRDELFRILATYHAPRAFRLMQSNGVLSYILPDAEYIENLEFFNNMAVGQQINDAEIVRLFILYRPNEALAENRAVRLKLNKGQKNLLVNLAKMENDFAAFLTTDEQKMMIYRFGNALCQAKWLTLIAREEKFPDDMWEIYTRLGELPQPKFPLKGKDLIAAGLQNNQEIGSMMKELEKRWIESGFAYTKEQLLDQIKQVV